MQNFQQHYIGQLTDFVWNDVKKRMKRWLEPHLHWFLKKQFKECNLTDKTLASEGCQKLFKTE